MIWHNLDTVGVIKGNQELQNNEFSMSVSVKDIHFEFGSLAHSYLLRDNHGDLWSNWIEFEWIEIDKCQSLCLIIGQLFHHVTKQFINCSHSEPTLTGIHCCCPGPVHL